MAHEKKGRGAEVGQKHGTMRRTSMIRQSGGQPRSWRAREFVSIRGPAIFPFFLHYSLLECDLHSPAAVGLWALSAPCSHRVLRSGLSSSSSPTDGLLEEGPGLGEARGGKGKGKPRAAMEAWANRDATADDPSTVVETWSGWGALAEGKGHAENAPWTTYLPITNDGNPWGHWWGTG